MAKRMLIDANHPEETRVVVLDGNRLDEFDFESSTKKQIKGNIYLAKVTRVEPSLQAAFVDYGGNRHGFLPFVEIHPDYYRIPVGDRGAAAAGQEAAPAVEEDGEDALVPLEAALPEAVEVAPSAPAGEEEGGAGEQEAEALVAVPAEREGGALASPAEETAPSYEEKEISAEDAESEPESALFRSEGLGAEGAGETLASSPQEHGNGVAEAAESESIETIGGDEIEELGRPRPFRQYKIQEVIKRRQVMLVQVTKEERGNKGAALTSYLSLAGRYCVLMPNTARGGGISRKITSLTDRRRLKEILEELDLPEGMGVIVRTAGNERSKAEIKRDYEYLLRLWNEIRDLTLHSTAPALIYEEGNLIKRSIRDLYTRDIGEVWVEGEEGYKTAKAFMKMLMPSHAKRVQPYRDPQIGLFHRYQVESQIDAIHSPVVQLRSGGTVVINQTEALVAIDVNSGRATRERNIEETALKTNLEAAEEIARQLRLRDLAGLIVIDFIDMEEHKNQIAVERRLKEALKSDRARIQVGRISPFGLLELSRQRLRPSLAETSTQPCPYCAGTGNIRSTESAALHVLRSIEEEGIRRRSAEILVYVPTAVALYVLNQKRASLVQIEARYGIHVTLARDDALIPPNFRLERMRPAGPSEAPVPATLSLVPEIEEAEEAELAEEAVESEAKEELEERPHRRRRRRRRRTEEEAAPQPPAREFPGEPAEVRAAVPRARFEAGDETEEEEGAAAESVEGESPDDERRPRRRGRRGGRRRSRREVALEQPRRAMPKPAREETRGPAGRGRSRHRARAGGGLESARPLADGVEIVPSEEERESPPEKPLVAESGGETPSPAAGDGRAAAESGSETAAEAASAAPREEAPEAARTEAREEKPEPPYPVLTVTQKPAKPRKGWWQRLISSAEETSGET